MGILLLITQGAQLIASLVVPTMQLAAEIKAIFSKSGTNYDVEIKGYQDGALADDAAVGTLVDKWKKDNGFVE